MNIRPFQHDEVEAVVDLWIACGLVKPWNDPYLDVERKRRVAPDLFLVGEVNGRLAATAMGGYDGHRGWVNYLAVVPDLQGCGYGRQMMRYLERLLIARGCPKLNLQIRTSNKEVIAFYEAIGYQQDDVVSLGKRLISDGQ
jgi:ribosomal protein S18 acetylase RimI-like enzyme